MMRTKLYASCALTALLALSAAAQQSVDETRPASARGTVEIENVSGSVTITGWNRDEVAVRGTLGKGTERLDFKSTGERTSIRVVLPSGPLGARNIAGSDLEISVPKGSTVEVETVSADIAVDRVGGALDLESVSGSITVAGDPDSVEASSVSGTIRVDATTDDAQLETVSGDIETGPGLSGRLEAGSVSGAITVAGSMYDRVELETTSGKASFSAGLTSAASLEMSTVSGNLTLVVDPALNADVDVSTFSGSIHNQIGPKPERKSSFTPGEELRFSTGSGGGARIEATSFSGTISIERP